ncbi:MAG: hypothetical protein QXW35_03515 [Candidatus Aenigmatarchaeota archaeon]
MKRKIRLKNWIINNISKNKLDFEKAKDYALLYELLTEEYGLYELLNEIEVSLIIIPTSENIAYNIGRLEQFFIDKPDLIIHYS